MNNVEFSLVSGCRQLFSCPNVDRPNGFLCTIVLEVSFLAVELTLCLTSTVLRTLAWRAPGHCQNSTKRANCTFFWISPPDPRVVLRIPHLKASSRCHTPVTIFRRRLFHSGRKRYKLKSNLNNLKLWISFALCLTLNPNLSPSSNVDSHAGRMRQNLKVWDLPTP
jgi:hypothetical protein